jgi:hypothetical protein
METTGDLTVYRCTSYALQCLLQHYSGADGPVPGGAAGSGWGGPGPGRGAASPEPEGLYWMIRPDIQPLVKPYLTTRCGARRVGAVRPGRGRRDGCVLFPDRPLSRSTDADCLLARVFTSAVSVPPSVGAAIMGRPVTIRSCFPTGSKPRFPA